MMSQSKSPSKQHPKSVDFKCNACDLSFANKSNLKRHLVKVHQTTPDLLNQTLSLEYKVKCHECFDSFQTRVDLINHLRTKHSFSIQVCTDKFDSEERKRSEIFICVFAQLISILTSHSISNLLV